MKKIGNKNVFDVKNIQITCPNCKYEFPYNKRALDKKINNIGLKIFENAKLIKKISAIPDESRNDEELKRLKKENDNYKIILSDLKTKRETLKENEDITNYYNLKAIIKEFYGDKEYQRCLDEMLRRSSAYEVEDMMKLGFYSSSTGRPIKKV